MLQALAELSPSNCRYNPSQTDSTSGHAVSLGVADNGEFDHSLSRKDNSASLECRVFASGPGLGSSKSNGHCSGLKGLFVFASAASSEQTREAVTAAKATDYVLGG